MSKPIHCLTLALILCLSCLAGAGSQAQFVQPAESAQPAPVVETLAGRKVESITLRNAASPYVVVFEAGSRNTIDKWGRVLEGVAREATVFAYNRPGYGNSEAAITPRDGRTIVEELRRVLQQKDLKPPYVLVGHSLGGLYMQLFARAHPDEVKGLVLLDTLYPGDIKPTRDFPPTTRFAGWLLFSRAVWQEVEKIDATGDAVLALGAIDDMPIVRLRNQPKAHAGELPPIAVDFGVSRTDPATIDGIRKLYPKAKTIVVDSSHQVQLTSPDIVIDAVHDVLTDVSHPR